MKFALLIFNLILMAIVVLVSPTWPVFLALLAGYGIAVFSED